MEHHSFFTWYEVESPDVLYSEAYVEVLGNPTPMTREIMSEVFRNASRTVCRRRIVRGDVFGSVAVTLRFDKVVAETVADRAILAVDDPLFLARAEFWQSNENASPAVRAEEEIRGRDQKITSCVLLEFMREVNAIATAARLAELNENAEIGVYHLLCERTSP